MFEYCKFFSGRIKEGKSCVYSLQLHSGSFPQPLTEEEEKKFLALSAQGDLEARNILVERNLRLLAHIMKN